MLSVGMNCRLLSRPGRMRALQRFLDHIESHDRVWARLLQPDSGRGCEACANAQIECGTRVTVHRSPHVWRLLPA